MLKLDNNLLDELGLGALPPEQKQSMLQHIYDTLELRVGTRLANQMTDQQLDEFERFIDSGGDANQAQALQWLETNLPNYKQVVNDVFEELKVEIRGMAPQVLAASGIQASDQGQAQVQGQTQAWTQQPQATVPGAPAPTAMPPASPVPQAVPMSPVQPQAPQAIPPFGGSPQPQPQAQPPQGAQQDATVYPFPVQQPPAGPGNYGPQQDDGQRAA